MSTTVAEAVDFEEFIKQDSAEAKKVQQWQQAARRESVVADKPKVIYLAPDTITLLDESFISQGMKWGALLAYRPLVAGLTDADFIDFCKKAIQDYQDRRRRSTHLGYGSFSFSESWRETLVANRTKFSDGKRQYLLEWVLKTQFAPRKTPTNYGVEINQLNDFLHSDFPGTFAEYLSLPVSEERATALELFVFTDHGDLESFLSFVNYPHICDFGPAIQKRTRKLFFDQPREVWHAMIAADKSYRKKKSHQNAELFVKEVLNSLDPTAKPLTVAKPPAELRKAFGVKIMQSALTSETDYMPSHYMLLLEKSMEALPEEATLKNFADEYTKILSLIEAENWDLETLTCFLHALNFSRVWLRGQGANALNLLGDILEASSDMAIVKLLKEIVLASDGIVPTETEWRATLETPSYDTALDWFILSTVKNATDAKPQVIPEQIRFLRTRLSKVRGK